MPPITAVMTPLIVGNPEAAEIPKQRGRAIKNTRKPESRSDLQFSDRPGRPVLGTEFDWLAIEKSFISFTSNLS
jgi:hypothetical protein